MPANNERKNNPRSGKDEGPAEHQKSYSTSEAVISLRDEIAHQGDANRNQPERKRKPSKLEIGTFALVLATAGLLIIQDVILNSSDDTFKATLDNQKQSNERQLRAYVGIAPGDVEDFGIPKKWHVRFIRKNYGLTPAYDVGFSRMGFAIIKEGQPIDTGTFSCDHPAIGGLITMFPSTELPWNTVVTDPKVFPAEELQLVKTEDRRFVYWGTICYNDAFRRPHYTNYCWMYKGSSMTARDADGCLTHNDSN